MIPYLHKTPRLLQWIYPDLTWKRKSNHKVIYLTFDDGPIPEVTPLVLETLRQKAVKATFFCVGENIQKNPLVFEEIVKAGHSIGNHTFNHLDGWKTPIEPYLENISKCKSEIKKFNLSNRLFRPPYGKISRAQIKKVKKEHEIVMWDVLSGDFDTTLNDDDCLKKTIRATSKGSIVIFHDNIKAKGKIENVLPAYIDHFLERGFKFLPL